MRNAVKSPSKKTLPTALWLTAGVLTVGTAALVLLWTNNGAPSAKPPMLGNALVSAQELAFILLGAYSLLLSWQIFRRTGRAITREAAHEAAAIGELGVAIAQLKCINLTLRESEERLAITLNSIGDAVVATDVGGVVTLLNPVAAALTGWREDEAQGQAIDEVVQIFNKQSRARIALPINQALKRGLPQALENHTIIVSRDGQSSDIADSCAPITDRAGIVTGAVLVLRDMTHEYRVQQALKDSAALITSVLETVADGILTLRADTGVLAAINPAAQHMFGYDATEPLGAPLSTLIPELSANALTAMHTDAAAGSQAQAREFHGVRKDGSRFPLELALRSIALDGQHYYTSIVRDISARKQFESEQELLTRLLREQQVQLQQKNRALTDAKTIADRANLAKSEFLSSMSHELRTPLNAILGFAQLLESGTPSPGQRRSVEQILQAGWYLLDLINEILDLAMVESGKLSLSMEAVSLAEVLSECRTMIEPLTLKNQITLQFPLTVPDGFVRADRTRLKQVLINLLSNAIKYNRIGGNVALSVDPVESARLRIAIKDSGVGLSVEQLPQLFQPFNRLGREARSGEGTGIGLVMTKRLVELMGGAIGVESAIGEGSVFWIEIDTATIEPAALLPLANARTGVAAAGAADQSRTVLYVEDNPANLLLVEALMAQRSDLRFISARDAEEGVAMALAQRPDVIVMDINLPGLDGLAALHLLAAHPETAPIPVVALSANAVPRDIQQALDAGFFRYLTKPLKLVEFMQVLDLALSRPPPTSALPLAPSETTPDSA